jgi:three-Cys-motif partner protein
VLKIRNRHNISPDWLAQKISALVDASKTLKSISNVHYSGHSWSIVKLLLLGGWVYVYTTIIPKYYEIYRYIDLLAGSGTTYVEETKDIVVGSAFVPFFLAQNPFTEYVFVEKNRDFGDALQQRATGMRIGEKCAIYEGDCNIIINSLFPTAKNVHNLVFIDNQGFDVCWKTVELALSAETDILINFPTSSIKRIITEHSESLDEFYGNHSWANGQNDEDYLRIYMEQLKRTFWERRRKPAYVSNIRAGNAQFFYDIILGCKNGAYVRAWEYLKEKLDWKDNKVIGTTLDILNGRATRIDWFIGLQEEVESIENAEKEKTTSTTTLDKWFVTPPR